MKIQRLPFPAKQSPASRSFGGSRLSSGHRRTFSWMRSSKFDLPIISRSYFITRPMAGNNSKTSIARSLHTTCLRACTRPMQKNNHKTQTHKITGRQMIDITYQYKKFSIAHELSSKSNNPPHHRSICTKQTALINLTPSMHSHFLFSTAFTAVIKLTQMPRSMLSTIRPEEGARNSSPELKQAALSEDDELLMGMPREDVQEQLEQKLYSKDDKIFTIAKMEDAFSFPLQLDETMRPRETPDAECPKGKDSCFEQIVISTIDPNKITGNPEDLQMNFFEYPLAIDAWRCAECGTLVYPAQIADGIVEKLLATGLYYARLGNFQLAEFYNRRAANAATLNAITRANLGSFYFENLIKMKQQNEVNDELFRRYANYAVESLEKAVELGFDRWYAGSNSLTQQIAEAKIYERLGILYNDFLDERFKAEEYFTRLREFVKRYPQTREHVDRLRATLGLPEYHSLLNQGVMYITPWLELEPTDQRNENSTEREGLRQGILLLDQVIEECPQLHQAFLWKFRVLQALGLFREAFVTLKEGQHQFSLVAKKVREKNAAPQIQEKMHKFKIQYLRAEFHALKDLDDLTGAVEAIRKLLAVEPLFKNVSLLATTLIEAGKYQEAIDVCDEVEVALTHDQKESLERVRNTAAFAHNYKIKPEDFQKWQKEQKGQKLPHYNLRDVGLLPESNLSNPKHSKE